MLAYLELEIKQGGWGLIPGSCQLFFVLYFWPHNYLSLVAKWLGSVTPCVMIVSVRSNGRVC